MATILPFPTERRRRVRSPSRSERRGEIVIFSGIRIDRGPIDRQDPPLKAQQPKPGRSL